MGERDETAGPQPEQRTTQEGKGLDLPPATVLSSSGAGVEVSRGEYPEPAKLAFAAWCLQTTEERGEIRTIGQYSQQNGIPERTLYRWKAEDPIVTKALKGYRATIERNMHRVATRLIEAATQQADSRNLVPAARLLAELTDQIGPTRIELGGKVGLFDWLAGAKATEGPSDKPALQEKQNMHTIDVIVRDIEEGPTA